MGDVAADPPRKTKRSLQRCQGTSPAARQPAGAEHRQRPTGDRREQHREARDVPLPMRQRLLRLRVHVAADLQLAHALVVAEQMMRIHVGGQPVGRGCRLGWALLRRPHVCSCRGGYIGRQATRLIAPVHDEGEVSRRQHLQRSPKAQAADQQRFETGHRAETVPVDRDGGWVAVLGIGEFDEVYLGRSRIACRSSVVIPTDSTAPERVVI